MSKVQGPTGSGNGYLSIGAPLAKPDGGRIQGKMDEGGLWGTWRKGCVTGDTERYV